MHCVLHITARQSIFAAFHTVFRFFIRIIAFVVFMSLFIYVVIMEPTEKCLCIAEFFYAACRALCLSA